MGCEEWPLEQLDRECRCGGGPLGSVEDLKGLPKGIARERCMKSEE